MIQARQLTDLKELRRIANDRVEDIFAALDITGVTRDGTYGLRAKCPLHGGHSNTSLSYIKETMTWCCFGCWAHDGKNDIYGLVQQVLGEKTTFKGTVDWLCDYLGVRPMLDPSRSQPNALDGLVRESRSLVRMRHNSLPKEHKLKPMPVRVYDQCYIPDTSYFPSLGFSPTTIHRFRIGLCRTRGKPLNQRAFAPVLDESGEMVIGYTGRTIFPSCVLCGGNHRSGPCHAGHPKWLHYGFSSGSVLYNIDRACRFIKMTGIVVVCEGPKDIWWLDQNGVRNGVCVFGTRLSDCHLRMLLRHGATTLVLAMDNDSAGTISMRRISEKLGTYFKIVSLVGFIPDGSDVADLSSGVIQEKVKPYLRSLL